MNLESVQELAEAKERFAFLDAQFSDITKSKEELERLISDLEGTMRDMFTQTFEDGRRGLILRLFALHFFKGIGFFAEFRRFTRNGRIDR